MNKQLKAELERERERLALVERQIERLEAAPRALDYMPRDVRHEEARPSGHSTSIAPPGHASPSAE